MTRRELLQAFRVVLQGAVALAFPACASRREGGGARSPALPLDSPSATAELSGDEIENLVALAEVLVQGRALSASERADLVESINDRTLSTPGYLSLYRLTARLLDRLAQTRFPDLSLPQRAEIVLRHRLVPDGEPGTSSPPPSSSDSEAAVRVLAVPELIASYYRSPAGWAVVGYESSPGRCSDLVRYTRPE